MKKFNYRKWVTENKHGNINEQTGSMTGSMTGSTMGTMGTMGKPGTQNMFTGRPKSIKRKPRIKPMNKEIVTRGMLTKGKHTKNKSLKEVKNIIKKELKKIQLNEQWNDYCPGGCQQDLLDCQIYQNIQFQNAGVELGYTETGTQAMFVATVQQIIADNQTRIDLCDNNGFINYQIPNLSYPENSMLNMSFGQSPLGGSVYNQVEVGNWIGSSGSANLCYCYDEMQEIVNTLSTERFKCNAKGQCEGAMGDYTYPFASLEDCAASGCAAVQDGELISDPQDLDCTNFNSSLFSDADRAVVCYACNQGNIPSQLSQLCGCCPVQPDADLVAAKPPMDDRRMKMALDALVKKAETMKKGRGSRPMRENNLLEELKKDLKNKK